MSKVTKNESSYEIRWSLKPGLSGTTFHFVEEAGKPLYPIFAKSLEN